jgi:hypothetical protein
MKFIAPNENLSSYRNPYNFRYVSWFENLSQSFKPLFCNNLLTMTLTLSQEDDNSPARTNFSN